MPVSLEQGEALCLIHLEGQVDINSAAELKNLLLIALHSGKGLRLDLDRATELDVTALQLLWAANREAERTEKSFSVTGRVPQEISAAAIEAGFAGFPVPLDQRSAETVPAML